MKGRTLGMKRASSNGAWVARALFAIALGGIAASAAAQQEPSVPQPQAPVAADATAVAEHEERCDDGRDDDGDGLPDCADADCFEAPRCHAGGGEERTDAACGDFVDNDGDGAVDCDDGDCQVESIRACRGSWRGPAEDAATGSEPDDDLPELGEGQTIEDLIGRGGDANGERTDEVCSDGVDNDHDGRTDCADFGCRFDPQVTICHGTPGVRFSVVAGAGARMVWGYDASAMPEQIVEQPSAGFTTLQLRALGPIPFIENSFFLVNVRAEESIRLTFLTFNVPISQLGHYVSLNSGFGSLSTGLIISVARQPLLDPPRYLYREFEQGNGGALEVGGPIDDRGMLRFRVFGAAGAGLTTGNVGGVRLEDEDRSGNFAWAGGAALQLNAIGHFDRFDSPFLYTAVPATLAFIVGGKYDRRPDEHFVAYNAFAFFQFWHLTMRFETFGRFLFDDPATVPMRAAWNYTLGVLLVPRLIFAAADVGGVHWGQRPTPQLDASGRPRRELLEELQWRIGLHFYVWRSTGTLSLLYREHYQTPDARPSFFETEREIRVEGRFRY